MCLILADTRPMAVSGSLEGPRLRSNHKGFRASSAQSVINPSIDDNYTGISAIIIEDSLRHDRLGLAAMAPGAPAGTFSMSTGYIEPKYDKNRVELIGLPFSC